MGIPLFKPQFAHDCPAGYHDEEFLVPFEFTFSGSGLLQRGLPWQLDDDLPMRIRGIYFTEIRSPNGSTPGLVRIWDTSGNALSNDLILSLGMWGSGGIDNNDQQRYAWGFPIEPEMACHPGGVITFDFQLRTNATFGVAQLLGITTSPVSLFNGIIGAGASSHDVTLIDPSAPNVPLSIAVIAGNVEITLATDGASAITSTFLDVVIAINSDASLSGIITALWEAELDPAEIAVPQGPVTVPSGEASTPMTVRGTLLGVKRLKDC